MPGFTDLSNEICFEILRYLPPPDLGSFFSINKHLYALTAIQRIRYSSLKRRFSTSLDTKHPDSTARLIKNIMVDPEIALYVQHFTINGYRERRGGDDQDDERDPVGFTDSDIVQYKRALRDLGYPSSMRIVNSQSDFSSTPEPYLVSLALMFFSPNLTSIDIRYSRDFEISTFYRLSRRLMEKICQHTDTKSSGVLFTRLTSITISAPVDGDIDLIEFFATLPSVKIINAENFASNTDSLEAVAPEKGSNVSDLNIFNADVSPHRLTVHLQKFEWLQSFTYWPKSDPQRRYDFDAFMIITALLASAQNSLRELHIRSSSATSKYMASLRKFRVLEYLEIDTDLLFGNSLEELQYFHFSAYFSALLPSSIEEVKLHGWDSTDDELTILLTDATKSKNELPSLRSIEFFETTHSEQALTTLEAMCARVNISLKITDSEPVSLPIYTRHRGHYAERQAKKALAQRESLRVNQSV